MKADQVRALLPGWDDPKVPEVWPASCAFGFPNSLPQMHAPSLAERGCSGSWAGETRESAAGAAPAPAQLEGRARLPARRGSAPPTPGDLPTLQHRWRRRVGATLPEVQSSSPHRLPMGGGGLIRPRDSAHTSRGRPGSKVPLE